jgi:PKD repeat protein
MGKHRGLIVLFFLALCLVPAVSAVHYQAAGTISTLTDYPENRWEIGISGENVIWVEPGEEYGEQILYLYNIPEKEAQKIASSKYSTFHPEIADDLLLWGEKTDSSGPVNLFHYDIPDKSLSYADPYMSNQDFPATEGNTIVWLDSRTGGYTNIYIKKGDGGRSYLFYRSDTSEKQNPEISNGYVYWVEKGTLYRQNVDSENAEAIISEMPDGYSISGENIVWEYGSGDQIDIALLDTDAMSVETEVDDPGDQLNPDIGGDNIVWQENEDGRNLIKVKNIETGISAGIYSSYYLQSEPKISGDYIVWLDSTPGKEAVRMFELDSYAVPSADFISDAEPSLVPFTVHFVPGITTSINIKPDLVWDFGDGTFSSEAEPDHTYTEPGIYNISLTISNEYGKRTELKPSYVIAGDLPIPDFYSEITTGNTPLTVRFTDNSTGDYETRLWDFGDEVGSKLKNPLHTYEEPGLYTVTLTLSNRFGSVTETKYGYIRAGFEVDLQEPDITEKKEALGLPDIFTKERSESSGNRSAMPSFEVDDFIELLNN